MLAALLPVGVLIATQVAGGGVAQAQVGFVLSGSAALIVDRCQLMVTRLATNTGRTLRVGPIPAAGLAAAACAGLTTLAIPLSGGHISRPAGIAALGTGLLAAGLLAPGLPGAPGRARDVAWRLLIVAIAGAVLATSPIAWVLAVGAVAWWAASWVAHSVVMRSRGPMVADLATEVVLLSELSLDPVTERRRLHDVRFGVVRRGSEHRLVDAASPRIVTLPHDRRIDWWRLSERVPVVDGTLRMTTVVPALDAHPRLLVQVGDAVIGVLVREPERDQSAPVTVTSARPWGNP